MVSVTDLAELVEPTAVVLKLNAVADNVTGALPVPLRLSVCGLLMALSAKANVPLAAPSAAGVNVTPTLQVAPAATAVPHVLLEIANGPPAATEMPVKVSATLSLLVTVTVFAGLVLPNASVPKLKLVAEKLSGALPLPVKLTICVPALSVIVRTPEVAPITVGANTTLMVHDAEGASAKLQLLLWLKGPVTAMLVICSSPVPLLCTVTLLALLVFPITCEENEIAAGVIVADGVVPVPESASACDVPRLEESSVTLMVPASVPVAAGLNVTDTTQLDAGSSVVGQLFVSENGPVAENVSASMLLPPKLLTVMVCGALVEPMFCENVSVSGVKLMAEGRGVGNDTGTAP